MFLSRRTKTIFLPSFPPPPSPPAVVEWCGTMIMWLMAVRNVGGMPWLESVLSVEVCVGGNGGEQWTWWAYIHWPILSVHWFIKSRMSYPNKLNTREWCIYKWLLEMSSWKDIYICVAIDLARAIISCRGVGRILQGGALDSRCMVDQTF